MFESRGMRLPDPELGTIDSTCADVVHLSKHILNAEERVEFCSLIRSLRTSDTARLVQRRLRSLHGLGALGPFYSSMFFERTLHLQCTSPLPFGENYSILLDPPTLSLGETRDLVNVATSAALAVTTFFAQLLATHPEEQCCSWLTDYGSDYLSKEATLDASQFRRLMGHSRSPPDLKDGVGVAARWTEELMGHHKGATGDWEPSDAGHICVLYRGAVGVVDVLVPSREGRKVIQPWNRLYTQIYDVVTKVSEWEEQSLGNDCVEGLKWLGFLSCLERDEAAIVRTRLREARDGCEDVLEAIAWLESCLFCLCIDDDEPHLPPFDPSDVATVSQHRNWLNYAPTCLGPTSGQCNRWFEKGLQVLIRHSRDDKDGVVTPSVGLNFEHSVIDSGAAHALAFFIARQFEAQPWKAERMCQEVAERCAHPLVLAGSSRPCDSRSETFIATRRAAAKAEDRMCIEMGRTTRCVEFADTNGGAALFKAHGLSPDGCIQVAIQLAFSEYLGRPAQSLETVDMRHFGGARLAIVYTHTEALAKLLCATRLEEELRWFEAAVFAHVARLKKTKATGLESYLHLFLLANEVGTVAGVPPHPIVNSSSYEKVYRHDLITSNLGRSPGVQFVFSGLPTEPGMFIVGYMIKEEQVLFTITSSEEILPAADGRSLERVLSASISRVKEWVERINTE